MTCAVQGMRSDESDDIGPKLGRWVDQVLNRNYHRFLPAEVWSPAINLCEDDTHYCMMVDLAGVEIGEIDLRVEKGHLILSGERAVPKLGDPTGQVRLHLMEIDHGRYARKLRLPGDVDVDAIEASYRNGFLHVRLPKKR